MSLLRTTSGLQKETKNIFTVDLEDWFHFEFGGFSVPLDSWGQMESRVEAVTEQLLKVLDDHQTTATFFVLGWIAERYPKLVKNIVDLGHEVGCHTYCHHQINQIEPAVFRQDLKKAKAILEEASGQPVLGFRAPYFSINRTSEWAFEVLLEEGFLYDSSIFPAKRLIGGSPSSPNVPHIIHSKAGDLYEIPISTISMLGIRFSIFGGGYFRLLPVRLILSGIKRLNRDGIPVNFYIHPHDLDIGQPRVKMDSFSRFRRYVGVSRTTKKLDQLLGKASFCTVKDRLATINWARD
jgi:polysaccharide deacetylase family protein (PEP-CTERM system associated)